MSDTPTEIQARYEEELLRCSPGRRMEMACDMFGAAKALALAGLRMSLGEGAELRSAFFLRFYGEDFAPEVRARLADRLRGD